MYNNFRMFEIIDKNIVFERVLEGKEATYGEYRFRSEKINQFLRRSKINLYSHQADAIKILLKDKKNVVITTPTASGKSLIYILTILQKIEENPSSTSILMFPINALVNDQYERIKEIIEKVGLKATVSVYTGQTEEKERRRIKTDQPNILITTPDMLNKGILPWHRNWDFFIGNLDTVVIDELHSYRGIFGSHVANVIRRLNRMVEHYRGIKPQYILNSATIKNPREFAQRFVQDDVVQASASGSPSPKRIVRVYKSLDKNTVSKMVIEFLVKNIPTIVFLDSRREVELLALRINNILKREGREKLIDYITSYRSGYEPSERNEIERKLKSGKCKVVISTSALEMGVDIGSLDACIVVGYPGTLSSIWQRFGRVGRRGKTAYNLFIPSTNILDQYFLKNPEDLFIRSMEEPVINPENSYILKKHLIAMASEKPISISSIRNSTEKYYIRELMLEEKLTLKGNKLYPKIKESFSIRQDDEHFVIVSRETGRTIGSINGHMAFYETHKNAVYIHQGKRYIVDFIDFLSKTVYISEKDIDYFTDPIVNTDVKVLKVEKSKSLGDMELFYGDISIKSTLVGYSLRDINSYRKIKDEKLEEVLERKITTKAMWFVMPLEWEDIVLEQTKKEKIKDLLQFLKDFPVEPYLLKAFQELLNRPSYKVSELRDLLQNHEGYFKNLFSKPNMKSKYTDLADFGKSVIFISEVFLGGLHGVEHSMIGMFSLITMNDRWDIGGMSTQIHQDTERSTVFIYDGFEGGIGYSEMGFERFTDLVELTYKNVSKCTCLNGCPSCILSPKCGNMNQFLDKTSTKVLLRMIRNILTF
ncbi:MAG: DEAD/DEAH box helicase [Hydrogenothermaceae bacterium]|nr:DEAD/DEAH box helicase [Hydrogenothermaceae bacterium]